VVPSPHINQNRRDIPKLDNNTVERRHPVDRLGTSSRSRYQPYDKSTPSTGYTNNHNNNRRASTTRLDNKAPSTGHNNNHNNNRRASTTRLDNSAPSTGHYVRPPPTGDGRDNSAPSTGHYVRPPPTGDGRDNSAPSTGHYVRPPPTGDGRMKRPEQNGPPPSAMFPHPPTVQTHSALAIPRQKKARYWRLVV
jgi:hypothetical protein